MSFEYCAIQTWKTFDEMNIGCYFSLWKYFHLIIMVSISTNVILIMIIQSYTIFYAEKKPQMAVVWTCKVLINVIMVDE